MSHWMGMVWDDFPYYPTSSHHFAHNIPGRIAVSREFIVIYRRVSLSQEGLTILAPMPGSIPLYTTPGIGPYPPEGGRSSKNVLLSIVLEPRDGRKSG